jgi:ComF family protein
MRSATTNGGLLKTTIGWCNAALRWVYPEVCQICGDKQATHEQAYLCEDCRKSVRFVTPPFCDRCGRPFPGNITRTFVCDSCINHQWAFSSARAAAITGGVLLKVIHRYKYHRSLWLEPFLAELLIQAATPCLQAGTWDWLVPVPLYPTKEREREFNQAERLGRHLSKKTGIPLNCKLLQRVLPTPSQTFLTRKERQNNVRRAFCLRGKPDIVGRRIVVIDDVFTTGATTGACAEVLKRAGAADVCVWTVARGP